MFDRTNEINQILKTQYFKFHDARNYRPANYKYIEVRNKDEIRVEEVKEIEVKRFTVSEFDDPDLHAARPMIEWEKSEMGQWIMKNAVDVPTWHKIVNYSSLEHIYSIRAKLAGPSLTEYLLRYSK